MSKKVETIDDLRGVTTYCEGTEKVVFIDERGNELEMDSEAVYHYDPVRDEERYIITIRCK